MYAKRMQTHMETHPECMDLEPIETIYDNPVEYVLNGWCEDCKQVVVLEGAELCFDDEDDQEEVK
jgi:hypothetical protein